ncbi:hypothetical protein ElyMa_002441000 [Elysia marginata]|uniref:Uncharacterized protein n=1 Tax=Elysia marginata TaxID=1093978 RepID=A0AAV4GIV9_9GAST|nr:hypothetical protein ElyMa_002441000 [Elysia marginata]
MQLDCSGQSGSPENRHSTGFDSTDTKFLAVVLGSTAACVVIVIIIFAITFYTKKSRCVMCDQDRHGYTSAGECSDGEDSREDSPVGDKVYTNKGRAGGGGRGRSTREDSPCWDSDTEQPGVKATAEAVYAEIGDPGNANLPRYDDIFREQGNPDSEARSGGPPRTKKSKRDKNSNPDPFTNASAPPLYTEVSRGKKPATSIPGNNNREKERCSDSYVNAPNAVRAQPMLRSGFEPVHVGNDTEVRVKQPAVHGSRRVSEDANRQHNKQEVKPHTSHQNTQRSKEEGRTQNDPKYYNVQEKKKKKRKASSGSGGSVSANTSRPESSNAGSGSNTAGCSRGKGDARRSKASGVPATAMEMTLSKSCSASETMGKSSSPESSETSLSRSQKRQSAPPGSTVYENQNLVYSPLHSQTPPEPPQSAAPPRPSTTGTTTSSSPSTDAIANMAKTNHPCEVIYEAQAPSRNVGKERKFKHGRRSSNLSSPLKPSNSVCSNSGAPEKETGTSTDHSYENANLVTLSADSAININSVKPTIKQQNLATNSKNSKAVSSGFGSHKQSQLEAAEQQVPLLSSSSERVTSAKEHSEAAILNLSSGDDDSEPAGPVSFPQESPIESSKDTCNARSSSSNTYDKLQFEEPTKMSSGKAHSPNAHVYQSLETAGIVTIDSSISCDKNVETVVGVDDKVKSQPPSSGLSRNNSTEQSSGIESKDCDSSPPPPLLPPRCPIALNKRVVDGLSV